MEGLEIFKGADKLPNKLPPQLKYSKLKKS